MSDILEKLKERQRGGCSTPTHYGEVSQAIAEIERLRAELKIVENGAAACGRFVLAHKDLALEDDPAAYLIEKAQGVAERKGGTTAWLDDMMNGSIKEKEKARCLAFLDAAKMREMIRLPDKGSIVHGPAWGKGFSAGVEMYAIELHRAADGVKSSSAPP